MEFKYRVKPKLKGRMLKRFYRISVAELPINWRDRPKITLTENELRDVCRRLSFFSDDIYKTIQGDR